MPTAEQVDLSEETTLSFNFDLNTARKMPAFSPAVFDLYFPLIGACLSVRRDY